MPTFTYLARVLVCSTICATSFQFTQPVQAQTLFEKLFPKAAERRRARLELRQRQQRVQEAVEVKKIEAPKYYTYKPDQLKKFGLGDLSKSLASLNPPAPAKIWVANSAFPTDFQQLDGQQELTVGRFENAPPEFSFALAKQYLDRVSLMTESGVTQAITGHYTKNPEFLWVDGEGMANVAARTALAFMAKADSYGLNSEDYRVALPEKTENLAQKLERAIAFEMEMSAKALLYAADASHGKVDPNRLSGYHDFPANKANYSALMAGIAAEKLPMRFLSKSHPQVAAFDSMRDELARLRRENSPVQTVSIRNGTFIKPGASNDQLPNVLAAIKLHGSKNLLTTFGETLSAYQDSHEYTPDLVKLVKAFQSEKKLGPDGIIGRNTIAKLVGVSSQEKVDKVLMAMERLRWHPTDLGSTHVFINQPAYRATYVQGGVPKLSMRAIVGKKSNQTSFFHDEIETVVYNPYWGVPRSILVNEFLPKLRANPAYLDERGYEVTNSRGVQVASSSIDWWQVGGSPPYDVRQTPGPSNALGELKILFPNKHAIYMHDTPSRSLFNQSARALSHGCVRLHKPKEMAAAVLGTSVSHINQKLSQGHSKQSVSRKIPVYVAYFTAWPDTSGEMAYFGDIYGRDRALMKAILVTRKVRQDALTG